MSFIYQMVDTWNAIGTTFNAIYMNISNGAGGAPVGASASRAFRLDANSLSIFDVDITGNTSIYSTYTDASNFKRLVIGANAFSLGINAFQVLCGGAGTGVGGSSLFIGAEDSDGQIFFRAGNNSRWHIEAAGNFIAGTDNSYDIGASGANRPRSIYMGSDIIGGTYVSNSNFNLGLDLTGGASGSLLLGSGCFIKWTDGAGMFNTADVILARDAANTLALRNSTNAQSLKVYNTFTDASNYSRIGLQFFGGEGRLIGEAAGTGTVPDIGIYGNTQVNLGTTGLGGIYKITTAGLLAVIDATYDIGASLATRPNNTFIAGFLKTGVRTLASLPTAASAGSGARMFISDATAPTFNVTASGGGATPMVVFSNGADWKIG